MTGHVIAEQLAKNFVNRVFNEADTRHQIIDRLLHEVLAWPHSAVRCEKNVHPGYIDYTLIDPAGRAALLIEAKRETQSFTLPSKVTKSTAMKSIRLRTLATDAAIGEAVNQAVQYCPEIGCPFACVTNGHEFIIFRSFVSGRNYLDTDALVIPSLSFYSDHYTKAYNLLGYEAVTRDKSLNKEFGNRNSFGRELHYPKSGISNYDAVVQQNVYAKFLDPIAKHYFGELPLTNKRMMEHCYVFARGTRQMEQGLKTRISDEITSFFKADGAQDIADVRSGGKLAERIAKSLQNQSTGEVLILYGGKGAGKSTFLRRLLYIDPPVELAVRGFPIIVDCLRAPQSKAELTDYVWEQITNALDQNKILEGDLAGLLKLFDDRFVVAQKQELLGLDPASAEYAAARNHLVALWKKERPYVAVRLKEYWRTNGKRVIVAFDNTDQLPPALQDHCFLVGQSIAREMLCTGIISMREERYCRARTVGVLDAYQNAGYHLAAPDLEGVFVKRINFVILELQHAASDAVKLLPEDAPLADLKKFFLVCLKQFRAKDNALKRFLEECSRDNTRLALEFFKQFIASGYTHVEEMVANPYWTVIGHQVVKPMMVPQRFNYDENKSLIPNVYQCRGRSRGSHFTTVRILHALRRGISTTPVEGGFTRVDSLVDELESRFGNRDDCETTIDMMLRYGLIEANNRLDSYAVEKAGTDGREFIYADEIRITAFGIYMLDDLSRSFSYLDLVSLDCGLADESLYHAFCRAASKERAAGTDKKKRLESRLERAAQFVQYLEGEEEREKAEYLLSETEGFMQDIRGSFDRDAARTLESAKRNI